MNNKIRLFWLKMALLLPMLAFVASCKDDDDDSDIKDPDGTLAANKEINDWIQENMEFYYFWNKQLPSSPDKNKTPDAFFESLLVQDDKFSWIQNNYQELLNSLKGISKEPGFEYVLYTEDQNSPILIMQILYVKPNSPASSTGLKRGDVITHINDQQITTSNYRTLVPQIRENSSSVRYTPIALEKGGFDAERTINLTALEYTENPNYLSKVIPVGNHKIGYFVYNIFTDGKDDAYIKEMEQIFQNFKDANITDLVLDLRFNSGGTETSSVALASLIGKGISSSTTFARREYNELVEEEIMKDPEGPAFLITKFKDKTANIGNQLQQGRVYILTSNRTASASELVINALKPFMNVYLIGNVTAGKNVGSISIYEENNPKNKWGMQPIIVKIYNNQNESDYDDGFTPDILNKDNNLMLYPLGDPNENLLSKAIGQITGQISGGREKVVGDAKEPFSHSLDYKRRSYNLVIDQNIPAFLKP